MSQADWCWLSKLLLCPSPLTGLQPLCYCCSRSIAPLFAAWLLKEQVYRHTDAEMTSFPTHILTFWINAQTQSTQMLFKHLSLHFLVLLFTDGGRSIQRVFRFEVAKLIWLIDKWIYRKNIHWSTILRISLAEIKISTCAFMWGFHVRHGSKLHVLGLLVGQYKTF